MLAFTQHDVIESSEFTPRRVGLDHLSFAVPDRAALEAWRARLDELGIAAARPLPDSGVLSVEVRVYERCAVASTAGALGRPRAKTT